MVAAILFGSLILGLLISVPVGVALGVACMVTILAVEPISFSTFTQAMLQGLNSFPLMAVPLFTFAGNIMGKGGISKRLINLANIFFGRFDSGLGIITIVVCMFFAAISGTGSATVAAIGCMMIPSMVQAGYNRDYAGAMVATAGTIGVIIPPSVPMVVYAVAANVSVTGLFMAGIIPGIVVGMALILYNIYYCRKNGYKVEKKKYSLKEKLHIFVDSIPALIVPVIILGGIYGGIFTPTEAAAVAAVYGIFVSIFVYKEVSVKELFHIGYEAVYLGATVLIIIGISSGFGKILTISQVPDMIANAILSITSSKVLILLMVNILLLIVGTFMETNAAIIILVPILAPILKACDVNMVHFGVVMVLNLAIGFITPPLGANLFMACQVGEIKFDNLIRKIVPWIVVMVVVLMIITYVPAISLTLPKLLGTPV